ncbi:amidohydrolase family protein [Thalassotalea piscium]|uniref:Imidazolonepropionase-like amidohydrolase n=1 Tax=Thalassotalea piscium TaxID=1230533 RepID=A0A7X0NDT2_9GAMM|nr:amidohydrolase family protein [Thalassotalea piscium]MBB6541601.1 imidazolonepropionase-like amidohydrolase [Thalassotalea piscium]
MKNLTIFKSSLVALALAAASSAFAQSVAITNATVHTVTDQGVLTNATVVMDNGVITAINPESVSADTVIDAEGKILTPGFIGVMNQLGLVEVSAVSRTRDAGDKKADITFDPSIAFNPRSTLIPYSRKGGITSNVVAPSGGDDMFKGQAFVADLSGSFDSVIEKNTAVIIDLGSQSRGSRVLALQKLRVTLEDAKDDLAKAKKAKSKKDDKAKEPKRDEKVINALLAGETPLVAYADRATDLLELINIKKEFGVNIVVSGGADAVLVAKQLAEAEVPVIVSSISNLPSSFDSLHSSLDNAAKLKEAGVKVLLTISGDTHNLYQLRFDTGIAVANGLAQEDALAAITANIADVFSFNAGRIAVGKKADVVLWTADPFEISTQVDKMWINGEEVSTRSRQDALRDRYTTPSNMPRAYTK